MKSIVQTIGKRMGGGERGGVKISLFMSILLRVKNAESPPTASADRIKMHKI
jgi:hypothetical protein